MEQHFTKKDWKLYQEKLPEWQETHMERLCKEYVELLSGEGEASERFWNLDKRIKEDKRHTGVQCTLERSEVIAQISELLHDKTITMDELAEFSDELREAVEEYRRFWGI